MTVNLALEYIPKRMCELGYGAGYHIRFRHLVLRPSEIRPLPGYGQLFLLIEPAGDVRVESDTGFYDLSKNLTNELQYEHQGEIVITNLSIVQGHVLFIQVIPN